MGRTSAVGHGNAHFTARLGIGGAADGRGGVVGHVRYVDVNHRRGRVNHVAFACVVVARFSVVACFVVHFGVNGVFALRQRHRYFNFVRTVRFHGGGQYLGRTGTVGHGQGHHLAFFNVGGGAGDQRGVVVAQVRCINRNGCSGIH